MANITERQTKSGAAYRIRVSAGYDDNYTQIMRSMTYKPKPGMSQRQIKAEVNRQAVLFEEKVRQEQAEKKKRIERGWMMTSACQPSVCVLNRWLRNG